MTQHLLERPSSPSLAPAPRASASTSGASGSGLGSGRLASVPPAHAPSHASARGSSTALSPTSPRRLVAASADGAADAATNTAINTANGEAGEAKAPGAVPFVWGALRRTAHHSAVQDRLLLAYFALFAVALLLGNGPDRPTQIARVAVDVIILSFGLALTRGELLGPPNAGSTGFARARSFVYRVTIFGTLFLSYFQLQHILPAVSSRAVDSSIFALDERVFGFEPSLAWDKFVNPQTTEWFAFFYFGYFFLLTIHVMPFLLWARDTRLTARFSLGIYIVFCTAHLLYIVVPGFGPYRFLAERFDHQLTGGLFWRLVVETVTGAGAQKDIFPSLHTAAPTYFVLFAFRHRHRKPFRYAWPFLAFFTSQIIIATMFLRWHYLIDICAGLTLATFAVVVSTRVEAWEAARREATGRPPVFGIPPVAFGEKDI